MELVEAVGAVAVDPDAQEPDEPSSMLQCEHPLDRSVGVHRCPEAIVVPEWRRGFDDHVGRAAVNGTGDRLGLQRRRRGRQGHTLQHRERQRADGETCLVSRAIEAGDLDAGVAAGDMGDDLAEAHGLRKPAGHRLGQALGRRRSRSDRSCRRRTAAGWILSARKPPKLRRDIAQHRQRRRVPHVGVVGRDAHQVDRGSRDALLQQPLACRHVELRPARIEPSGNIVTERAEAEHVGRLEDMRQDGALGANRAIGGRIRP